MPNNTLELCKRLKDAGFPQKGNGVSWVKYRNQHGKIEIITIASIEYMEDAMDKGYDFTGEIIAYEPTPIEVEEAVIELVKQTGNKNFRYLEMTIYSDGEIYYCLNSDAYNVKPDVSSVEDDRFTAIAELWLKIKGI